MPASMLGIPGLTGMIPIDEFVRNTIGAQLTLGAQTGFITGEKGKIIGRNLAGTGQFIPGALSAASTRGTGETQAATRNVFFDRGITIQNQNVVIDSTTSDFANRSI